MTEKIHPDEHEILLRLEICAKASKFILVQSGHCITDVRQRDETIDTMRQ